MGGHHHHHHHHHAGTQNNILLAFFLNFVFAIIELVGGIYTNSVSILSDAVHDLGDSFSLLTAYILERFSRKNADKKFTYGYRRFSILGALINGMILIISSLFILGESVERVMSPEPVNAMGMIPLAILGIAVNSFAAWRLSKGEGLNSRMVMMHLIEDILGWASVLVVAVILLFKPWYILDSILSILISLIVLRGVYQSMKKVGAIFLQMFPDELEMDQLIKKIKEIPEVLDVHQVKGWSVDESSFSLSFHVSVASETQMSEVDRIKQSIKALLASQNVTDASIEFESSDFKCG